MPSLDYLSNVLLGCADVAIGADPAYFGGQWKRHHAPSGAVCSSGGKIYDVSLDFQVPPEQRIDPAAYEITAVTLEVAAIDFAPRAPLQSSFLFTNLGIFLRNEVSSVRQPQLAIADTPGAMNAIHLGGTNYYLAGSTVFQPGGYTSLPLSASFYNSPTAPFFAYQQDGFIGLTLRRTVGNATDWLVLALSALDAGRLAPRLRITYRPIKRPAQIQNFITAGTQVWSRQVPLNFIVSDTEEETQRVTVSGSLFLNGANINRYVPLALSPDELLPSSKEGYGSQRLAELPFQRASIASVSGYNYYRQMSYTNCSYASGVITMTANNAVVSDKSSPLQVGVDLKPNTVYRLGVAYASTGGLKPVARIARASTAAVIEERWLTGSYDPAVRSTYVEFNSSVEPTLLPTVRASGAGGVVSITDIVLAERDVDTSPATIHLVAQLFDDDGASAPSGIYIQHDARLASAPQISAEGVKSGQYTANPIGKFSWTRPNTGAMRVTEYRYAFNNLPDFQITATNTVLSTSGTQLTYAFPWDDQWRLHVAAVTENGLIGETGHFDYFYNVPSTFNDASGVYCNGRPLATNQTAWINHDLRPKFSWSVPLQTAAQTTYQMQIGAAGGVTGYTTEPFTIDWLAIPENAGMYFRLQLHDMQGIRYLDRNTTLDAARWEVYDQQDKQWKQLTSVLSGFTPSRSSLPYAACGSQPRYSQVRYTLSEADAVPDDIGFYATIACGYYSPELNFIWQQPNQPKSFAFSSTPGVSGVLTHFAIIVPDGEHLNLASQFSSDGFQTYSTLRSGDFPRAFTEVYKHDPATLAALYFRDSSLLDEISGASARLIATGTNSGGSFVPARSATEGGIAYRFQGDAYLTLAETREVGALPFTISFWGQFPPVGVARPLITKMGGSGYSIGLDSSGAMTILVKSGSRQTSLNTGQNHSGYAWNHYLVQWDPSLGLSLWINGARFMQGAPQPLIGDLSSGTPLQLGGASDSSGISELMLDDVLIWNRQLAPEEIGWLANWHFERRLIGPERVFSAYGLRGDGASLTVRCHARREFALPAGTYGYRCQWSLPGGSAFRPVRTVALARQTPPGYIWSFQAPEVDVSGITTTEHKLTSDLQQLASTYIVRWRVFDGFEYSPWSARYKFRVNRKPSPPSNLLIQ